MWIWAEFKLAKNVYLDTRYHHLGSNWANALHFMSRTPVQPGDRCTSRFRVDEDRINWSMEWTLHA